MRKGAKARIKINKLLTDSGWRFEDDEKGKANIQLERGVRYSALGDDFEHEKNGFIDFLLVDQNSRAIVVVAANNESIDPLSANEQASNYARNSGVRFIILTNGNIHYFWDTLQGNPETISRFPTQDSLSQHEKYIPNPDELAAAYVDENYLLDSQMPWYVKDPAFLNEATRDEFLRNNNLKQLRRYSVQAIKHLQYAVLERKKRFLFEMAAGTGKTVISAALIKLFLTTGNARRVLFLVDRRELEEQANNAFKQCLGKEYTSVIYKDSRDSWQNAHIVVSTMQTFLAGNRYKKEFSPTDFEFVISDEAHRSIDGDSSVVVDYFVGYKLGLTATPIDYMKGFATTVYDTQREFERRQLLDRYKTFGCESGEPTYRYDLMSGVKDGFLIQPVMVDARTDVTTELLSEMGYASYMPTNTSERIAEVVDERPNERKFFSEETNIAMCKAFIDNGLFDPIARKNNVALFGKSIVFCVSQKHAVRITNILNKLAFDKWPTLYTESDFAMQMTSQASNAKQLTINFANNRLGGQPMRPVGYDSSKTRVAVTVGMMTTGYDCQDLLNIGLMRPVFSPSDFVQIKGRGTRKYRFQYKDAASNEITAIEKDTYKFFDFFANCVYFENEFQYDEKIKLPLIKKVKEIEPTTHKGMMQGEFEDEEGNRIFKGPVVFATSDELKTITQNPVGEAVIRFDRESFKRAVEEDVLGNEILRNLWENGDIEEAEVFAKKQIFEKPKYFLNLDKIRTLFGIDRRITVKEFLQVAFGTKDTFEMKDELLESEWERFMEVHPVDQAHYESVKMFFKAYITDEKVREIVASGETASFTTESSFRFDQYQQLNGYIIIVPQYIHDYAYQLTNL